MILSAGEKNLCAQDYESGREFVDGQSAWAEAREMLLETIQRMDLEEIKQCVLSDKQATELEDIREDELQERAQEISGEEIEEARHMMAERIKDFVDDLK